MGSAKLFVPRDRYDTFAADLLKEGGSFDLIEPRRRDVEEYFLDLVRTRGEIQMRLKTWHCLVIAGSGGSGGLLSVSPCRLQLD